MDIASASVNLWLRELIYPFFFSITPFNLYISSDKVLTLCSNSGILRLTFVDSSSCLCSCSFWPWIILNSFVILDICPADNLRFYWCVLTSSSREFFSASNFWTLCLNDSDSCPVSSSLILMFPSSPFNFWFWAADNLKFYWWSWIYPPKALI